MKHRTGERLNYFLGETEKKRFAKYHDLAIRKTS